MAWKEVYLDRVPAQDSVIYVNKSGISLSAAFIKKFGLVKSKRIKFFVDEDDIYSLGFKFFVTENEPNTLSLMATGRSKGGSAGFTVKAQELFSKNPVIKGISKLTNKKDRTFEVAYDKKKDIFSVLFRPNFEFAVSWLDKNKIQENLKGIYRYQDKFNQTIYIGKGNIKSRANSPERDEWGVKTIEYSVILDDEKCYYWENYYLEDFVSKNGVKPSFNVILGKTIEAENN